MVPSTSAQSIGSLNGARLGAADLPFGLRSSIALGSGLRSGVVLLDAADQAIAELKVARETAAEAARDAARAEAKLKEAETRNPRAAGETEERAPINTGRYGLSEGDAERSINAAQAAGQSGERAGRGTFVNLAV